MEEEKKKMKNQEQSNNGGKKYNLEREAIPLLRRNYLHFFLFLLFLPLLSADILPGSTLYAAKPNQSWSSSDNTYSLRFIPAAGGYSLAITYNPGGGAAAPIPVWVAGGDAAVADADASFQFSSSGDLRLVKRSGAVLWRSNTSNRGVSRATLDESGNLILKNASHSLWTSFEHPVSTLVPSQNFTLNMTLSSGSYSFNLKSNGNLSLTWGNSIMYWNFGANSSLSMNLTSPSLQLQPNGILNLNDPSFPSAVNLAYSSDFGENSQFRFLRLDSDGNLRMYSFNNGVSEPIVKWTGVSDQCEVFGFCGNMGICSYNSTGPTCLCPSQNFHPIDPSDTRKGCRRKIELQNCPGNATLLQLDHTKFLTYPPETSTDVYILDSSACRSTCLENSPCVASTTLASELGYCYMKTSGFISGYSSPAIPSTSFVKVCSPGLPNPPFSPTQPGNSAPWKLHSWVVVVLLLLGVAIMVLVALFLWLWCCKSSPGGFSAQYSLLEYASGAPVQFSYKELHRATKGFKDKVGAGGFGAIYKGVLVNKTVVAVKNLEGIGQGEKQFRMEVSTISSTHHLNLVRLIGFCSEGRRHRLLVYEFMKNGSLDRFLFQSGSVLRWECLFKIALGAARGITYLHEECRDCIIHCDLKPENILLDDSFNAKVSDFGLAKLLKPQDYRDRSINVRGTRGYMAPEWRLANLPVTSKSDVYSYGMVLLEIVSGIRNFEVFEETNGQKFWQWAYEEFEKGNVMAIVDKRLIEDSVVEIDQVARAIAVSFWCIQEQPAHRPTMGKVAQMLEGVVGIEKPPSPRPAEGSAFMFSVNAPEVPALESEISLEMERPSSTLLEKE